MGAGEAFEVLNDGSGCLDRVDEQADVDAGCVQVVGSIWAWCSGSRALTALSSTDHLLFHEQVGEKITNGLATKVHRNRFLGFDRNPLVHKRDQHAFS